MRIVFALALLWTFVDCQSIVVTPANNQTVPINIDVNVTYSCIVDGGNLAEWVVNRIQIASGSDLINTLSQAGIFIESVASNETTIIITQRGRETFSNQDLIISCTALDQTSEALDIKFGPVNYVRTFAVPNTPRNFDFNPFPENTSRLVLTWDEPDNTLFDTGDAVVTTYSVVASGPTVNFSQSTIGRRFEFFDSVTNDCATHDFTVSASNEAGQGMSVTINATIPIAPDIEDLKKSLAVSSIDLRSGVAVHVSFQRASTCSPDFAILHYVVTVVGGENETFLVTDERIQGQEMITLPVPSSGLLQNRVYSVFVSACISVTCRHSTPVQFMTTDVQSARVSFFENNVLLDCTFANRSSAAGCTFIFTVSENDTEIFRVPIAEQKQCTRSENMQNAYPSIVVVDWEADMTLGLFEISLESNLEFTDAVNFTQATSCVPFVPVEPLSPGAIVGIVIGVLIAVALILATVIVVAIVCYIHKTNMVKVKKESNDEVCVDMDEQCLLNTAHKRRGSFSSKKSAKVSMKEGIEETDGGYQVSMKEEIEETDGGYQAQPSSPAPRLRISKTGKRTQFHLNRALVNEILRGRSMAFDNYRFQD